MLRQQHRAQPIVSPWERFVAQFLILCGLIIIFSLIISVFVWLIFIPTYLRNYPKNPSIYTGQTVMWHLKFSTNVNLKRILNETSIDIDALGLSIDRAIDLSSHSTVVFRADLIVDKNRSNEKLHQNEDRFEIDLKFQYPERCCGIRDCEDLFEYQILRKFRRERGKILVLRSHNDVDEQLMAYLDELIVSDKKPINNSEFYQTEYIF